MAKTDTNRCPKCGEKLSLFYFKQNCPKCGANILYYDMENRLAADAEQAQKEWDAVSRLLNGILMSSVKTVYGIFRIIFYILSTVAMLLPVFKSGAISFDLITIIKGIMNGEIAFGALLTMGLLPTLAMVLNILMTTVCLIVGLFSYTKNGMKRDIVLACIQILSFAGVSVAAAATGIQIQAGFFLVLLTMAGAFVMSILLGNKLKQINAAVETEEE